jgi:hypothetical protein
VAKFDVGDNQVGLAEPLSTRLQTANRNSSIFKNLLLGFEDYIVRTPRACNSSFSFSFSFLPVDEI